MIVDPASLGALFNEKRAFVSGTYAVVATYVEATRYEARRRARGLPSRTERQIAMRLGASVRMTSTADLFAEAWNRQSTLVAILSGGPLPPPRPWDVRRIREARRGKHGQEVS